MGLRRSTASHATASGPVGRARGETGFSLIETLIAMTILATALMSLAGVFVLGLGQLSESSAGLTAREKAREAIESVHTARDTKTIAWCQIRNVATPTNCAGGAAGVFLDGVQPLKTPGIDGLVGTADDLVLEMVIGPGPDNILGTTDDTKTPMSNFTRQIVISNLLLANGTVNPNLRQLTVTIGYRVGRSTRSYVLTTYVSAIS